MRCEDFLSSLETGGFVKRLLARRHAARCRRCTEAAAAIERLTQELAKSEPLTRELRQCWVQAASGVQQAANGPQRDARKLRDQPFVMRQWPKLAVAAAAAAAVVLAIVLWPKSGDERSTEPPNWSPGPEASVSAIRTVQVEPADALARLDAEIANAEAEIAALIDRVERMQASRQAGELLAAYGRW